MVMAPANIYRNLAAAALLAALVFAAFGGALKCGFVLFDDNLYVTENAQVQGGLSAAGVRWAFTTGHSANWHPLTWLAHMADVELYGLAPAGHHATSLLLHAANAILLFLVLRGWTGRYWPPLLAAALWAVHPLRAESVVWISERKDVLAMFFLLLALLAYGRREQRGRMGWTALAFALSLMAKPLGVTLPFLLLLADVWPLRRRPGVPWRTLVLEKWPLFGLAVASCAVTFFVQAAGGAVRAVSYYPAGVRLANAALAGMEYVRALIWPFRLMVFYPHPGADIAAGRAWAAAAGLALLTAGAWAAARRRPWWMVGWLWFLGALVPMLGLVQVGGQAWADRYSYLPHIGLLTALVWGAAESAAALKARRLQQGWAVLAAGLVAGLVFLSQRQTLVWRDSETLFRHALAIREDSSLAHTNLGIYCVIEKRDVEAEQHLRRSLEILEGNGATHGVLGALLAKQGRAAEAEQHLRRSMALQKDNAFALGALGALHAKQGRVAEGEKLLRESLARQPRFNESNGNLANVCLQSGRTAEAVRLYRIAVEDDPRDKDSLNNLAWLLASDPDASRAQAEEALACARRAVELAGDPPPAAQLDTLALAQAAGGDFAAAAATARAALAMMAPAEDAELQAGLQERLRNYVDGRMPPP